MLTYEITSLPSNETIQAVVEIVGGKCHRSPVADDFVMAPVLKSIEV